ncbi:TPA: DNA cytosine methyltransferase [Shigella sonnei]|uniref:Cytosine-specific methyltransferase n=7 Tax=Enterobacteriaceae TaxID=543 RepID=A0A376JUP0_ECOLX|nr:MULTISPECIES: DNA cytosine methyltransferase [Enterobacteriaceae]EFP7699337.1 DNA cytosine methyltransferase [Shigella flexneri]EFW55676.1 DNA-cytosine methyltransferase [Shigella boydii ATCC 9905]MED9632644.1 DNA cytosine methyltransferase [Escherichia marmotae]EAA1438760.1 DNA cytosine methyltransferase [Shigella sonnei]EAB1028188.1 DNA cytosine methyltransferase [Shigella sonnei]
MTVKVIDLFCGAGGLTHGLQLAGLDVVAGIDLEGECRFPYERNNKSKFIEQDIAKVTKEELLRLYGDASVKVLAGCAPCQPFSKYTQGKDKADDKKWPLLYEFERLIREVSPEIVTMENVPDVTKHKVYNDFYNSLLKLGYYVWASKIDCVEYGIPQNRSRHVLLASKLGAIELVKRDDVILKTVRDAIGNLPPLEDGQTDPNDILHRASKLNPINKKRIIHSVPGGTWKDWPKELVAACHMKSSGKGYASVYGRMSWDKPSPTITTLCYGFGNGRFGHPEQHRAISLREAALLQTFPMDYIFVEDKNKFVIRSIGKMIGNAVPVELGKAIGQSIKNHLE